LERAVLTGLIFTVVVIVVIKWFTGIALMPLLLLAIVVFVLAFGFSLRMQRLNSPRR
jgi:Zn-dependent protease with chaperone function